MTNPQPKNQKDSNTNEDKGRGNTEPQKPSPSQEDYKNREGNFIAEKDNNTSSDSKMNSNRQ